MVTYRIKTVDGHQEGQVIVRNEHHEEEVIVESGLCYAHLDTSCNAIVSMLEQFIPWHSVGIKHFTKPVALN